MPSDPHVVKEAEGRHQGRCAHSHGRGGSCGPCQPASGGDRTCGAFSGNAPGGAGTCGALDGHTGDSLVVAS